MAVLMRPDRYRIIGVTAMIVAIFAGVQTTTMAAATSDTNTVEVVVTDAQVGNPVPLADVTLSGTKPLAGLTGIDGRVVFHDVPPGRYAGNVVKDGYRATDIHRLIVRSGSDLAVHVTLSRLIGVIGTVVAKSRPHFDPNRAALDTGSAFAAGSAHHALALDPLLDLSAGEGASQALSVEGMAPEQSSVSVDGIPLAPPGTSVNLRALGINVFDASDLRSQPSGAGIDFHIPDPTIAFGATGSWSYASFGSGDDSYAARGTAGYLGYSFGFARDQWASPLDGKIYLDESLTAYPHAAHADTSTAVIKLRAPLSEENFVDTEMVSSGYSAPLFCDVYAGALPCGFGPGNGSSQSLDAFSVKDTALLGRGTASATLFSSHLRGEDDESRRVIGGIGDPLVANYSARTGGAHLRVDFASAGRNAFALDAQGYATTTDGTAEVGDILAAVPRTSSSYFDAYIADAYRMTPRLTSAVTVAINGTSQTSGIPAVNLALEATPNEDGRYSLQIGAGQVLPVVSIAQGLSEPTALQFDCATHTAFGDAPASGSASGESIGAQLDAQRRFGETVVALTAYRRVVHNALLDGLVAGSALAPSPFTQSYLSSSSQFFASPAGCGIAASLAPADFALHLRTFGTAIYQGMRVAALVHPLPDLELQPFYAVTSAAPTDGIAGSTIQAGRQLLGVPLQKFGVLIDQRWRGLEAVGLYRHITAGNANFLPAYDLVDVGLNIPTQHGEIAASVTNLFNRYGMTLGSPTQAEPVMLGGLGMIRPLALPLQPRTFRIAYRFHVGAPPPMKQTAEAAEDLGLPNSATIKPRSLSQFSGDPFALQTNDPQCGPEEAALARPVIQALAGYVRSGRYVAVKDLPNGETAMLRHGPTGHPAFILNGSRGVVGTALFRCGVVHFGFAKQAERMGLYVPTKAESNDMQVLFALPVGFYVTADYADVAMVRTHLSPLLGAPPVDPFALAPGAASCTSEYRSAATYILGALRTYFGRPGEADGLPDGVMVRAVQAHPPVYALSFIDPSAQTAIEACGTVYGINASQAAARRVPLPPEGGLYYAPGIGLYEGAGARP